MGHEPQVGQDLCDGVVTRRGDGSQARNGQPHWSRNSEPPSQAHRLIGVLGVATGEGTPFPSQLLRSYGPKGYIFASLLSPNLKPHRVPEDGQESPLEENAELCEGTSGKGVAFNGIHFLGREN